MKSNLIAVLLLQFYCTFVYAQNCTPGDSLVYQTLQGCDSILKREETRVLFPGYTENVIQEGTGACEQRSTCNPLARPFAGKEECWPEFKKAKVSHGSWERTVVDAKVVIGYVGSCTEKNGDFIESVPLFGPKCAPAEERTASVNHSCETAGGQVPWFNPFYAPPPPCTWGFNPGVPYCGDLEPINK